MTDRLVYDLFDRDALWFINGTTQDGALSKKLEKARTKIKTLYDAATKAQNTQDAASSISAKLYRSVQTLFVTKDVKKLRLNALTAMGYLHDDAVGSSKLSTVTKQTWMRVSNIVAQCIILNYITVFTGSPHVPAVVNYIYEDTWVSPIDQMQNTTANRLIVQVFLQQRGGEIFVTFPELGGETLHNLDAFTEGIFFKNLLVFLSMECHIAKLLDDSVMLMYEPAWTNTVEDAPEIDRDIGLKVIRWTGKTNFTTDRDNVKKAGTVAMLAASDNEKAVRVNRGLENLFKVSTQGNRKSTVNTDHNEVITFFSDALRLLLSNDTFPHAAIKDLSRPRSKNEVFSYLKSRWETTSTTSFDIHEELLQLVIVSFTMMVGVANQFNHFNKMMGLTMSHDVVDTASNSARAQTPKYNLKNVADLWRWLYAYSVPEDKHATRRLWIDKDYVDVVVRENALKMTKAAQAEVNRQNLAKYQGREGTLKQELKTEKEHVAELELQLKNNVGDANRAAELQCAKEKEMSTLQETINRLSDESSRLRAKLTQRDADAAARMAEISQLISTLDERDATLAHRQIALDDCVTDLAKKVDPVASIPSISQESQTSADDVTRLKKELSGLKSERDKLLENIEKLQQQNTLHQQHSREASATCDAQVDTQDLKVPPEIISRNPEEYLTLPVPTRADSQQYGYRYPPISVLPDEPSQPGLAPAPARRSRIMETFARGNMPSISLAALADMDLAGLDPDERRILAASLRI